jgi:hypothetical protein
MTERRYIPINGGERDVRAEAADEFGIRPGQRLDGETTLKLVRRSLELEREWHRKATA